MTERLYIARGDGGLFKVGRTGDWHTRLYRLRCQFKQRGDVIAESHLFPMALESAHCAEMTMIQILQETGHESAGGHEWFRDVSFAWARCTGNLAVRYGGLVSAQFKEHMASLAPPAARTANAPRKADRHRCATG